MMSFKMFLGQQDDTISDQDAVKKYNEYKEEFRIKQMNEFFLQHKEEEWCVYYVSISIFYMTGLIVNYKVNCFENAKSENFWLEK